MTGPEMDRALAKKLAPGFLWMSDDSRTIYLLQHPAFVSMAHDSREGEYFVEFCPNQKHSIKGCGCNLVQVFGPDLAETVREAAWKALCG